MFFEFEKVKDIKSCAGCQFMNPDCFVCERFVTYRKVSLTEIKEKRRLKEYETKN